MVRNKKLKYIIFLNDQEFTDFAINKSYVLKKSEKNDMEYYDIDYTDEYLDCLKNNYAFIIKDKNSSVLKHNAVTHGVITKTIENVELYKQYKKQKI